VDKNKKYGDFLKAHENTFPMITKTSIFCQIMPEKNEVKDANPLK